MGFELRQLVRQHQFDEVEIPPRMSWTASSVRLFRKCKRKWFWKYIMRLRPIVEAEGLLIGTGFHHCLGGWYKGKRIKIDKLAVQQTAEMRGKINNGDLDLYDQADLDKMNVAIDAFRGMMRGYEQVYNDDRQRWDIIPESIEAQFKVDMGDFDYLGKIDLVGREKKKKFVVEHKTSSSIRESYLDRLPLDTQIRGYVMGCNKGLGIQVDEVLYDVILKYRLRRKSNESVSDFTDRIATAYANEPNKYFFRETLTFTRHDLASLEHELRLNHKEYQRIIDECTTHSGKKLNSRAVMQAIDPWTWAPNDGACDDYFRICEYYQLCVDGLDRGTGSAFEQGDDLHEELAAE